MAKRTSSSTPIMRSKRHKITADQTRLESSSERNDAQLTIKLAEKDGPDLDITQEGWNRRSSESAALAEVIDIDVEPEESGPPRGAQVLSSGPHWLSYTSQSGEASFSGRALAADNHVPPASDATGPPPYRLLSQETFTFDLEDQAWPSGVAAPYSFLAHTLAHLAKTRSRAAIINILTNSLRTIIRFHTSSLLPTLYLLSNSLSPAYRSVELGLGPSSISRAIQHVSGISSQALKRLYISAGDPGDVAFEAKSDLRTLVPHNPLIVDAVYASLLNIAQLRGPGATKQKQAIAEKLLVAAKGEEVRYLVRTLCQNLRVGAVRTSILIALARAMVLTPPPDMTIALPKDSPYYVGVGLLSQAVKSPSTRDELYLRFSRAETLIREVYVQHPNYDDIVKALLEAGLDGLRERVPLTIGIPLHPTLGSPARSLNEVYERLGSAPFSAELKLDGQRAQIHACKDADSLVSIWIFSRHLEDMTDKYPDVVLLMTRMLQKSSRAQSFIVDSEIVAVDPSDGSLKSFQELSNRARKDVAVEDVKVAVAVFAFDLMFMDGEILLQHPFRRRRAMLRTRLPPLELGQQEAFARFEHVESCDSEAGRDAIAAFWLKAVESRCEGLMIKLLNNEALLHGPGRRKPLPATYEPDKRTSAWLKLKKDYVRGLGDSLDLVPIGAWHGNGRKAQWWSPILLAIYDPGLGKPVAVCKCMSGFTDAFYKALRGRYQEDSHTCSSRPLWDCDTGDLIPEVFFKPQEVWEIRGADVTLSPVSVAALGTVSDTRGLSLRFPRFIKVRGDKTVETASSPDFLAAMYRGQQGKGKKKTCADDGELLDIEVEDESEIEEAESDSERRAK